MSAFGARIFKKMADRGMETVFFQGELKGQAAECRPGISPKG
jgi:hypothetical protein